MLDRAYLDRLLLCDRFQWEAGLTDEEVARVEQRFSFRFPPDLRMLLQFALPVGDFFPNWRRGPDESLQKSFDWPRDGMVFDVEQNSLWRPEWGERPASEAARFEIVRRVVEAAPKLIPIYSHRYLPADPCEAGNSVLSVHQTDIIGYGNDLADYFENEFEIPRPDWAATSWKPVRFWDDVMLWWY